MERASDRIVACPRCGWRARVPDWNSAFVSHSQRWSDGKTVTAHELVPPPAAPCRRCRRVYWWPDAIVGSGVVIVPFFAGASTCGVGTVYVVYELPVILTLLLGVAILGLLALIEHFWSLPPASESQLLDAIDAGLGSDPDREATLRRLAWWAANDPARRPGAQPAPRGERAEANLRRLYALLDPTSADEKLLKAEAARELGEFAAASDLLAGDFPPELVPEAARLRELVAAGDARVARLD